MATATTTEATEAEDLAHMRAALGLARRGLGNVWPNPAVGCVLVQPGPEGKPGRIVGRGWTQPGGRPHAETEALARAGAAAKGATAYVTLEPCAHQGESAPCTEALIAAGVARVVVATEDPDPRVDGAGIETLTEAGMDGDVGLLEDEAQALNEGYFTNRRQGLPLVTLKLASSLDGRIATAAGASRWITGTASRNWAHGMRARHDAIMVGIGTALADNPSLTCRLPGLPLRPPVRVVFDSHLRLPLDCDLVADAAEIPLWLVAAAGVDTKKRAALTERGAEVVEVEPDDDGRPKLAEALTALAGRGLTRVLVEGGGVLAAGLIRAGLVDRLAWFRSSSLIGGDGVPAIAGIGVEDLDLAPFFFREETIRIEDDVLETFRRRR